MVFVKPLGQYGELLGFSDNFQKYEINLLRSNDSSSLQSSKSQKDEWMSPQQKNGGRKWTESTSKTSKENVVYCYLADIELHHGDDPEQGQKQTEILSNNNPLSTVGIDIDTWKPIVIHDFLAKYNEFNQQKQCNSHDGRDISSEVTFEDKIAGGYYKHLLHGGSDEDCTPQNSWTQVSTLVADKHVTNMSQVHEELAAQKPKSHGKKHSHLEPARDLVLSIWDFAGQEIYHAAQEAFFSERALYLVVWDMRKNSESEMDRYVQFWIDLIQSRAPGSTIIVVGTRADKVAKKVRRPRCALLRKHLRLREELRKKRIAEDLKSAEERGDSEQVACLRELYKNRPIICPVIPVSCVSMWGFNVLISQIISLSRPTKKNRNPFQLVDIEIPRFWIEIKGIIEKIRRNGNHIVTISQIEELVATSFNNKLSEHVTNDIRDAVTFLSSIGEVVFFPLVSPENSHCHHSDLKSDFDDITEFSSAAHGNSKTSSSCTTFTTDFADNNSTWREVYDLEAKLSSRDDISNMVFLSPHWLINVLKRVLSHHLVDTVQNLTTSMNRSDLNRYFGDNYEEYAKNGIVKWSLIKEKLMQIRINSNFDSTFRYVDGATMKKNILHSLM